MLRTALFRFAAVLAGFLLAVAPVRQARAQGLPLSDAAQVSLVTVLPGDAVHSLYGHSAIRIYDPVRGINESFNYGTFDFDATFLPKFLYGKLDYFLSHYGFGLAVRHYREVEERPVVEQVLSLNADQREAVFRFLMVNARPENRYYRYDFLFDNCSTRIRDLFEETLGEDLRFVAPGDRAPADGQTFRQILDPYQGPFLDFGIDLLLGSPVDRTALPRETMFLPDYLMAAFDEAVVDTGAIVPLVARTDTVVWIENYRRGEEGVDWASVVLWLLFGVGALVTYRDYRAGHTVRRALDVPVFAFAGVLGVLIAFLWFVSLHDVTAQNWNLLWAWPTHLVAAGALLRRRPPGRWLRRYLAAAAVVPVAVVLGWPVWPQALPATSLPVLLLLALCSARAAMTEDTGRTQGADRTT